MSETPKRFVAITERFILPGFIFAALTYIIRGLYLLNVDNGGYDFWMRWLEQQYVYSGVFPYDVFKGSNLIDPALGAIHSGGYFASSFFVSYAFIPPGLPLSAARWWFTGLNLISLVVIALFVFQRMHKFGSQRAWLATFMCLAISSHSTTLALGHYGILINAVLCLMVVFLERHQPILAGFCFGIAMVKPTFAGLYLLPLTRYGKATAVLSFSLFFSVANLVIWFATGTDPWTIVMHIFQEIEFVERSLSAINIGTLIGFSVGQSVVIFAALGLLAYAWISWYLREAPLLTQLAGAAVIGRVATYHLSYDDVMLVFLLIPLIQLSFENPHVKSHSFMLLVVGMSLWAPVGGAAPSWVLALKSVVWVFGLAWLMLHACNRSRGTALKGSRG